MIGWFSGLGGKIQAGLAALGVILAAIGIAFLKGRKAGQEHIQQEQQRKRDELQAEYDRIDAGPVDPSGAYQRLRSRNRTK
jgi:hypothetical protein